MIEVQRVSKWFGSVQAVRDVSFQAAAGQVLGLLGPNGAGKTTTIRMVTGCHPPSRGSVRVCGHDTISDGIAARATLGYLPEANPLYPEMRVAEYVWFRARLLGVPRNTRRSAVDGAIHRCWLGDVARRRVGQLSKGYRQRAGLAGAIVHNPPVLVLDEPTSGLDPTQIGQSRDLIRELAQDRTVLLSSHILPEVERTCDRVMIFAYGRKLAEGTPSEIVTAESTGRGVVVAVRGTSEARSAARQRLETVAGDGRIERVSESGDELKARVERVGSDAHGLRIEIARALAETGVLVTELCADEPTLEQAFARIVGRGEA